MAEMPVTVEAPRSMGTLSGCWCAMLLNILSLEFMLRSCLRYENRKNNVKISGIPEEPVLSEQMKSVPSVTLDVSSGMLAGKVAHRVVNTGDLALVFNACWPSDAGHDYHPIEKHGFRARIIAKGDAYELEK